MNDKFVNRALRHTCTLTMTDSTPPLQIHNDDDDDNYDICIYHTIEAERIISAPLFFTTTTSNITRL